MTQQPYARQKNEQDVCTQTNEHTHTQKKQKHKIIKITSAIKLKGSKTINIKMIRRLRGSKNKKIKKLSLIWIGQVMHSSEKEADYPYLCYCLEQEASLPYCLLHAGRQWAGPLKWYIDAPAMTCQGSQHASNAFHGQNRALSVKEKGEN